MLKLLSLFQLTILLFLTLDVLYLGVSGGFDLTRSIVHIDIIPIMEGKVAIFVACLTCVVCLNTTDNPTNRESCISSIFGAEYRGTDNSTSSGKPCMRWDIVLPSSTTNWTAHVNYCRYFSGGQFGVGRSQPWCYTDGSGGWELCSVQRCDLPPYETCYRSPVAITNTKLTSDCNCSVSLSLKASPAVQLIRAIFVYPPAEEICTRDVVLNLEGKPLELTCEDGQSVDLSMQMTPNVSYNIGLGLKTDYNRNNQTGVGLHQITYTAMSYVHLTSCDVILPTDVRKSTGTSNVEIHTLDANGTDLPLHPHGAGDVIKHSNHTLKGLVIGLVVSAVVAVGVISVVTYIWLIDKRHMRSELLREYLGEDHLSSDEEKTYFSEPKAYINTIALDSERDEQPTPRTLDQLDPLALARNNKHLRPNGCSCVNIDAPDKRDLQNGHVTKIETAIVPINELENFDDLSDVIANPMAREVVNNCDVEPVADQENTV
ncbi:uncharacterized protein LOC135488460 [Lineus longissimus]|uniref:uncharacterized protein LOC135488460 n=1 Tax=Lineus longissimus TaxID=88925 RepID=UPI00315D1ECE